MKSIFICVLLFALISCLSTNIPAQDSGVYLLVRIDDMGFSHAANVACIEAYKNGVARSVEVIVPGPWFDEAVTMLNENPGLDVGVHLALTSEWQNLKWRPLTPSPSLTNEDGYFYPMIWKNDRFPEGSFLLESEWDIEEVEKEWRAQIELALKKIPHTSHLSGHMGCSNLNDATRDLYRRLGKEYGLDIFPEEPMVKRAPGWSGNELDGPEKEAQFIAMLETLTPGIWLTVEHPAYDWEELKPVGHIGYDNVGFDREGVTYALTSKKVKKAIEELGIILIDYQDLKKIAE